MDNPSVSYQVVANAFVEHYYQFLCRSPGISHRYYQDISKLSRPEKDGSMSTTTTIKAIDAKIVSLKYCYGKFTINSVDAQESFNGGVDILVTGHLIGKDFTARDFVQSFFLAPQQKGYFVLNDIFRFVDNGSANPDPDSEVLVDEPAVRVTSAPIDESVPSAKESFTTGVYNPPDNVDASVVDVEEASVAEVVDEALDDDGKERAPEQGDEWVLVPGELPHAHKHSS